MSHSDALRKTLAEMGGRLASKEEVEAALEDKTAAAQAEKTEIDGLVPNDCAKPKYFSARRRLEDVREALKATRGNLSRMTKERDDLRAKLSKAEEDLRSAQTGRECAVNDWHKWMQRAKDAESERDALRVALGSGEAPAIIDRLIYAWEEGDRDERRTAMRIAKEFISLASKRSDAQTTQSGG